MKLNSIDIEYFRCFNQYHIDFAPGVTVLIGKNGSGKTTLIDAVHKSLSFIFAKNTKQKNDRTLTSGIPSLRVESFDKKRDLVRDPDTGLAFPHISINAKGTFFQQPLEWEMYASTSTFKIQTTHYNSAFTTFMDIADRESRLPVLAFYSDGFPHLESKRATKTEKALSRLRNFGYYQWNEETACSSIWIERYKMLLKQWDRHDRKVKDLEHRIMEVRKIPVTGTVTEQDIEGDVAKFNELLSVEKAEREKLTPEVEAIKQCLVQFTKGDAVMEIHDLFLSVYDDELCIETASKHNPQFKKLPAGYKRLLYMVLDIAYRSYILNGTVRSSGIVVIDEVDLHLHPSLEQTVLQRLCDTFPDIQFIVSTHSALVVANLNTSVKDRVQHNKVYMLYPDRTEPQLLPNLYGVDYNATMRDFMGTPPRNENIKRLIDEYLSFRSMELEAEAASIYTKITSLVDKDEERTVLKEIEERLKGLSTR